jgi:uncharacterized protein YkwD
MSRVARLIVVAILVSALLVEGQGPSPALAQDKGPAPPADPVVARVVELTNAERQKAGLPPLSVNPDLAEAAQRYAEAMAATGCFEHTCPPIPELQGRVESAGYTQWGRLAENIAAGQRSAEQVVAAWMGSPGHKANILRDGVTEIGVGRAAGGSFGTYWVQDFGAPRPVAPPGGGEAAPGARPAPALPPIAPEAAAARVADLLNAERQKAGLPPLRLHPALVRAAQAYAELMAGSDCFGLDCGAVPQLDQRAEAAGYTGWAALAEGAAAGQQSPEEAAVQWLGGDAPPVLDPRFTDLGVGLAYGGRYRVYWTETLGATTAPSP